MNANRLAPVATDLAGRRTSRRRLLSTATLGLTSSALLGSNHRPTGAQASSTPLPPADDAAAEILALAQTAMAQYDLRAVILRVMIDGEEVVTAALGESMTGVPATPEMRFRNGSVAISYMSTFLLGLVDRGVVDLDSPLATFLPELPGADHATLRMLANMTAGYPDYVPDPGFVAANFADPFRPWTPDELIEISLAQPRVFAPGTNWDYSHANYVILGRALERIADAPLDALLREHVLDPLGLADTVNSSTAAIPEPGLHAFSAERRAALDIAPASRFYEESTYWDPSWTLAEGAIQTTTIADMAATAEAIGSGTLLSPALHQAQIGPDLLGFGALLEGCRTCHPLDERYGYGLGVVLNGPWIMQNPLFGGYGGVMGYLPARKIAIAIAATYGEASFDESGTYRHGNACQPIFAAIGAYMAPDEAPPLSR